MKKIWYMYPTEYHSAIKQNEILLFVAMWMDLEGIMLSEISQREKGNGITYIWNIYLKS